MPWVLQTSLGREVQLYSASCFGSEDPGWGGEETLALITGGPDGAQAAGAPGAAYNDMPQPEQGMNLSFS